MKKPGAIAGVGLLILSFASLPFAVLAAEQADAPALTIEDVEKEVKPTFELAKQTQAQLDGYVQRVVWIGGLGTIALTVLGFFGWNSLRDSMRRVVERNLEAAVGSALEESLPSVLSETQKRAESHLLQLSKILALHSYGAYDEALAEFGWDGHVSPLRDETAPLRRTLIDCLYSSKKDRPSRRDAAWEAATELIQDDDAPETNRLYLRLSISLRKHAEGLAFFERLKEPITTDKESALRSATLLRKVGRLSEALSLAESHADEDDLGSIVTVAVLQRDLGKFDEVHDVLRPAVNRLMSDPSPELPDGWHRVANTFVANCIDRQRYEDAIEPAAFVLRSAPGPVEVFTVGRLILSLGKEHPKRTELTGRFREAVSRLIPGEATTRCQVVLAQLDDKPEEAVALLQESIEAGTLPAGEGMKPDIYFQRCNLGQVLIAMKKTEDAIDALMPAAGFTFGGEAKFHLAVAYALQGEGRDSSRWLSQAVHESPKWAAHARDHVALRDVPEVIDELARLGRS